MVKKRDDKYLDMLQKADLDAYLLLLKKVVEHSRSRDLDHHEYYDEHVDESLIDPQPIDDIERELDKIQRAN